MRKIMDPVQAFENALEMHRVAKEFGSDEARAEYLRKHPQADPKNHTVKGKDPNAKHEPYGQEWKEKKEKKIKKDTDKEDTKIQKERAWAEGKEERDKKKQDKYDRDVARENKRLDKKEKSKEASEVTVFENALLSSRVAFRYSSGV